tara:strand:- start:10308 stop:12134 length:1827 start_codon:yes stop_codon:yes gene_type:complete
MKNIYTRLWNLISPHWLILLLATIASIFYVVFNSLSIWLTASFINNILSDFDLLIKSQEELKENLHTLNDQLKYLTNKLIIKSTPKETIKVLCISIISVFMIKNIFLYIKNLSLSFIQFNIITQLRKKLYSHLHSLSLSFFDNNKSGELTSIVITDVSNMRAALGTSFHKVFVEPINILAFISLLFIINVKLAIYSTIVVPITFGAIFWIGRSIRRKSRRTAKQIADIMGITTEILNSIRIVKAFGAEAFERKRFNDEQGRYYRLIFRRAKLQLFASPITETIGAFIAVVLLWVGGMDVLVHGIMESEDFIRFILILFSLLGPVRLLSNVSVNIQKGVASAERVFKILDTKPSIYNKVNAKNIKEFESKIEFGKVSFKYGEGNQVLKNINFTIPKGQIVALVGPSGAGKSTLADLLPRFYDVNTGSIKIDNHDIRDLNLNSLRKLMGIVTQETILFDDTIQSNITYGIKSYSNNDLENAAKAANAYNFIKEQPKGFETIIGEKGIKLSGGQRQRLAIARAILRNPPILILDEATSSLDVEAERKVQEALENLMLDRTTLVIAHRLSTVINADKIIVLDNGELVEIGDHKELYTKKGLYHKLYNIHFDY